MLKCGDDTLLRRPISLHNVHADEIELLFSACETDATAGGAGTRWLSGLTTGDNLDVIGPLGNGFSIEPSTNKILLVAGGIGVAPLKFLAESAVAMGKSVTALMGARTAAGLYPPGRWTQPVKLIQVTEDGSAGVKGMVTEIVSDYITRTDQVFACGPKAMYETLGKVLKKHNLRLPTQVSLEVRMGCGTGVCYSCSVKTKQGMKRVCKEGPVFNISDIIWQEVTT